MASPFFPRKGSGGNPLGFGGGKAWGELTPREMGKERRILKRDPVAAQELPQAVNRWPGGNGNGGGDRRSDAFASPVNPRRPLELPPVAPYSPPTQLAAAGSSDASHQPPAHQQQQQQPFQAAPQYSMPPLYSPPPQPPHAYGGSSSDGGALSAHLLQALEARFALEAGARDALSRELGRLRGEVSELRGQASDQARELQSLRSREHAVVQQLAAMEGELARGGRAAANGGGGGADPSGMMAAAAASISALTGRVQQLGEEVASGGGRLEALRGALAQGQRDAQQLVEGEARTRSQAEESLSTRLGALQRSVIELAMMAQAQGSSTAASSSSMMAAAAAAGAAAAMRNGGSSGGGGDGGSVMGGAGPSGDRRSSMDAAAEAVSLISRDMVHRATFEATTSALRSHIDEERSARERAMARLLQEVEGAGAAARAAALAAAATAGDDASRKADSVLAALTSAVAELSSRLRELGTGHASLASAAEADRGTVREAAGAALRRVEALEGALGAGSASAGRTSQALGDAILRGLQEEAGARHDALSSLSSDLGARLKEVSAQVGALQLEQQAHAQAVSSGGSGVAGGGGAGVSKSEISSLLARSEASASQAIEAAVGKVKANLVSALEAALESRAQGLQDELSSSLAAASRQHASALAEGLAAERGEREGLASRLDGTAAGVEEALRGNQVRMQEYVQEWAARFQGDVESWHGEFQRDVAAAMTGVQTALGATLERLQQEAAEAREAAAAVAAAAQGRSLAVEEGLRDLGDRVEALEQGASDAAEDIEGLRQAGALASERTAQALSALHESQQATAAAAAEAQQTARSAATTSAVSPGDGPVLRTARGGRRSSSSSVGLADGTASFPRAEEVDAAIAAAVAPLTAAVEQLRGDLATLRDETDGELGRLATGMAEAAGAAEAAARAQKRSDVDVGTLGDSLRSQLEELQTGVARAAEATARAITAHRAETEQSVEELQAAAADASAAAEAAQRQLAGELEEMRGVVEAESARQGAAVTGLRGELESRVAALSSALAAARTAAEEGGKALASRAASDLADSLRAERVRTGEELARLRAAQEAAVGAHASGSSGLMDAIRRVEEDARRGLLDARSHEADRLAAALSSVRTALESRIGDAVAGLRDGLEDVTDGLRKHDRELRRLRAADENGTPGGGEGGFGALNSPPHPAAAAAATSKLDAELRNVVRGVGALREDLERQGTVLEGHSVEIRRLGAGAKDAAAALSDLRDSAHHFEEALGSCMAAQRSTAERAAGAVAQLRSDVEARQAHAAQAQAQALQRHDEELAAHGARIRQLGSLAEGAGGPSVSTAAVNSATADLRQLVETQGRRLGSVTDRVADAEANLARFSAASAVAPPPGVPLGALEQDLHSHMEATSQAIAGLQEAMAAESAARVAGDDRIAQALSIESSERNKDLDDLADDTREQLQLLPHNVITAIGKQLQLTAGAINDLSDYTEITRTANFLVDTVADAFNADMAAAVCQDIVTEALQLNGVPTATAGNYPRSGSGRGSRPPTTGGAVAVALHSSQGSVGSADSTLGAAHPRSAGLGPRAPLVTHREGLKHGYSFSRIESSTGTNRYAPVER